MTQHYEPLARSWLRRSVPEDRSYLVEAPVGNDDDIASVLQGGTHTRRGCQVGLSIRWGHLVPIALVTEARRWSREVSLGTRVRCADLLGRTAMSSWRRGAE
jgi:hypothetical protein